MFGDLPVIGTLSQCVYTRTGWRGIDDDGIVVNVTRRPGSREPKPEMPQDWNDTDFVVRTDEKGRRIGAVLVKPKKQRPKKRR
jgi:hypothetical protein